MRKLETQGAITSGEIKALAYPTYQGQLGEVLRGARGMPPDSPLPADDLAFIEGLRTDILA